MQDLKSIKKLFTIPKEVVNDENFAEAMTQAIALELATIPTYLSTYYSINRSPGEDDIYNKIVAALPKDVENVKATAEELTVDVLVYANKTAALIMSVVIEEMLHLSLSSNVNQAIIGPPPLIDIASGLSFPTQLDGHQPEFPINLGKLSMQQLKTFLQIESPNVFKVGKKETLRVIKYTTIGEFYDMIIDYIENKYGGSYDIDRPQLLPDQPFYSQNSINTVYYDRDHKPHFTSEEDSKGLLGVVNSATAVDALNEIIEQGEGHQGGTQLEFDENGMPVPLPVVDGEVIFTPEDYDDPEKKELSHFAKFMEAYSLGGHYEEKFANHGLDFFDLFVYNQADNAKVADYTDNEVLKLIAELGNAMFTYIILMVETCYHSDKSTQFNVFMYGIHKSMIWLLSEFGNGINKESYTKEGVLYQGSLGFEFYDFSLDTVQSPKEQMVTMATKLGKLSSTWEWLITDTTYLEALPDVGLDYSVKANEPLIPKQ
ncbi:MAG: hypothetical protein JKY02_03040 [Flavobacteriaceae bacterium]|nr:hypothetical protein [Flavobacteriaceae bacterium]